MGPRATAIFLVLTAVLFGALLLVLSWRSTSSGLASWILALSVVVAVATIVVGVLFAKGVGEGRL